MAKYCPQCGAQVLETDKFCTECGATLIREDNSVPQENKAADCAAEIKNESEKTVKRHFKAAAEQQPARHFNAKPAAEVKTAEVKPVKTEKPAEEKPKAAEQVKKEEKPAKQQSAAEQQLFMDEKPAKKEKKHLFAKMDKPVEKGGRKQKQAAEPPVKEVEIKEPKKKKKKRFRLGKLIIIMLVLAILVEGVYMVLVDPGIEEIRQTIYELKDGKEYDYGTFVGADIDSSEVNITFSDAEVAKAKESRAAVTEEKTSAVFGNIKVEMSPYNLLGGDDELIVKSLGTKTDDGSGCSIEAYDFALASGEHEFCYHVVIDFPVEKNDDTYTEFVYYNESSKKWEPLYYEISEDGKYYHVYIDHFTKVGKQKRLFNLKKPLVRNTSELEKLMAQKGITLDMFFECMSPFTNDHMLFNVHMDTSLLLNKLENNTIKSIEQAVKNFHNKSMSLKRAFESLNNEKVAAYSEYSGYVEAGMTANEMTEFVFKDSKALSNLGLALSAVDFSLALFNIADEITLNPETSTLDLWRKRWSELITMGTAATAVLTLSGPVALQFGALSLAWYFGTYCYDQLQKIDEYNPDSKEIEWRFYDYYLHPNHNINVTKNHPYKTPLDGIMKKPSSMTDDEFQIFVNDMKKVCGLRSGDPKYWMPAFKSILKIYRNEPERVPDILDELYENFANAYFDLSKKERTKWQEEASRKLAIDIREYTPLGRLE
ncbi:MAG: zinc-ribbon domain-containing protein, partial [Erysipelotrichaceae bacterium]|nr:zinc-ribbon domain-containing protein [Erysipelotrichaceae bacterium]